MTITPKDYEPTMWDTDCISCDDERVRLQMESGDSLASALIRRMIVCPQCGNKRCPKATHHDNQCTGSNETGQSGSVYE